MLDWRLFAFGLGEIRQSISPLRMPDTSADQTRVQIAANGKKEPSGPVSCNAANVGYHDTKVSMESLKAQVCRESQIRFSQAIVFKCKIRSLNGLSAQSNGRSQSGFVAQIGS